MDINDAAKQIYALRGETMALQAMLASVLASLPEQQFVAALRDFETRAELGRVAISNSARADEDVIDGFERVVHAVLSMGGPRNPGLV